MSISTTYLLNVALHAAILSILASVLLLALRQARHRSVAAVAGLLAVGFLPWLTALRPARPFIPPAPQIQTEAPILPTWTVITLPVREVETPTPAVPAAEPAKFVLTDPLNLFAIVWATGTAVGLLLLGAAAFKVLRWRKSLLPIDDASWRTLNPISPEIPARRHFLLSDAHISPCVTGLFQPRIVLPKFLLETGDGLRWSVRHEAAHWNAGDSRWTILFALIRCANWWNPLVHALVSRWGDAREQLCDLHATEQTEDRADYGKFLIAMARKITNRPPLTVGMARRNHAKRLKQRISALFGATKSSAKSAGAIFVTANSAAFVSCGVLVSTFVISAGEPRKLSLEPERSSPTASSAPPAFQTDNWMVFSNVALGNANETIIRDGNLVPLINRYESADYLVGRASASQRFGEPERVEAMRKDDVKGLPIWGPPGYADSPGNLFAIKSEGTLVGSQVGVQVRVAYTFVVGHPLPTAPATGPPGIHKVQIKTVTGTSAAQLSIGDSVTTDLGEIEPGVFLQVFTRCIPLTSEGKPAGIFSGNRGKMPSAEVKGRLRISGMRIEVPAAELPSALKSHPINAYYPLKSDSLTWTFEQVRDSWESVLGSKIEPLGSVELPLNESHQPWPDLPGFELLAIASEDYKNLALTAKPAQAAMDLEIQKIPFISSGSEVTFALRSDNPQLVKRVFFKIEVDQMK